METISPQQAPRRPLWTFIPRPLRATEWARQALQSGRAWIGASVARARQRRALAQLDGRQLRDMGLHSDWVHAELRKWFWQG